MTPPEFTNWLAFHQASFPSVKDWANRRREDWQAIRAVWAELFEDVDLEEAKRATRAMLKGDLAQPTYVEEQVKAIRVAALAAVNERRHDPRGRRTVDGEQTFACGICLDSLMVDCWHTETVGKLRKGELKGGSVYTMVTFCDCAAAQDRQTKWANPKSPSHPKRNIPTYDPAKHCRVVGRRTLDNAIDQIMAWLHDATRCENYVPAFDAYNDSVEF